MTNLCGGLTTCWGWDTAPLSRSHPGRCPVSGQVSPPCLPPNCPGYTSDPPLLRVNSGIHLPCCLLNPIGIWVEFWVYRWMWGYTTRLVIHYLFIPEHTYSDLHYNVLRKDLTRFCLDIFSGNTELGFFGVFVLLLLPWMGSSPVGQITGVHEHYHFCLLLLLGQRSWTVVRSDNVFVRRPGFLRKPPNQFCCFHSVLKPISPSRLAVSSRATKTIRTESAHVVPVMNGKAAEHSSLMIMFADGLINSSHQVTGCLNLSDAFLKPRRTHCPSPTIFSCGA